MTRRSRAPAFAAWLAGMCVPASDRIAFLGDLEERYARRAHPGGEGEARRWYWGQTLRIVLALGPRRVFRTLPHLVAPGTLRAAFRSLRRDPGASLASVVTLGVGIAAPVAMFALADGVTKSLPRDREDRVVRISQVDRDGRVRVSFSRALIDGWNDEVAGYGGALVELAAFRSDGWIPVSGGNVGARRERGVYAMDGTFRLVDISPVAGRLYSDGETDGPPVVVVREDLAEERFGGVREAVGKVLALDRVDHVVVGVLPRDFGFPVDHRLWIQPRESRDLHWEVAGRLAAGASPRSAEEQLARAAVGVEQSPDPLGGRPLTVERYTEAHFAGAREPDTTRRIGALSILLVILTAVNVAALMVARGMARSRETAVRLAMGASRTQVIALTVVEGLVLATAGGVIGLSLGHGALKVMATYLAGQATIVPYWLDFSLAPRTLTVAGLMAILALSVSALLPGIQASRVSLDRALRQTRGGGPGGGARAMRWVVGLEVAISCLLLTVSGVVVEEALSRLRMGADFPTRGVLTGRFVLEPPHYATPDERRDFLTRLEETLGEDPAVKGLALTSALPGKEGAVFPVGIADRPTDGEPPPAQVRIVDPPFFTLLGIPASAGRLFFAADDGRSEPVAVVNRAFALAHGIQGDAIGRRIVLDGLAPDGPNAAMIVGVVEDRGVTPGVMGRGAPGVYLPVGQVPPPSPWVLLRTREGASIFDVWQRSVVTLDPHLPLGEVLTLEEALRRGHGAATLFMAVFLTLGSVTLLMSLVGLHGVHAFSMGRRAREIGVRRALGARSAQVLLDGIRRGLEPVWLGLLVGLPPGILVARAVVPVEGGARAWLLVPPLLLLTSILAVWRPTLRASVMEPTEVLHEL